MDLTLDGLVCGGHFDGKAPVIGGVQYVLTGLKGWWGSPATRTSRSARAGGPGSYRRPAYKGERSVAIEVTATSVARSALVMRQVERRLAALCADSDELYLLTVADEAGTTAAYVELDGDIDHAPRDGLRYSSVISIPVCAPDPRRIAPAWSSVVAPTPVTGSGGVVSTSSGVVSTSPGVASGTAARPAAVTVTGSGTAKRVPLVLEIDGPTSPDLVIVDAAGTSYLTYRGSLGAGESVWINCDDQDALDVPGAPGPIPAHGAVLNGVGGNARGAVSVRGDWPSLAAGQTATYLLGGSGAASAQLTAHTREAYA